MCLHTHEHICTHACTDIQMHAHTHTNTHILTITQTKPHIHINKYTHIYAQHTHTHLCTTHTNTQTHAHTYTCMCKSAHINTHTCMHTQTHIATHKHTVYYIMFTVFYIQKECSYVFSDEHALRQRQLKALYQHYNFIIPGNIFCTTLYNFVY